MSLPTATPDKVHFERMLALKIQAYTYWRNQGKSKDSSYNFVMVGSDWNEAQVKEFKERIKNI